MAVVPPTADAAPALPAATTVLLRDSDAGCEVLLVQPSAKLAFHGGAWVFPGGRVDAADAVDDAEVRVDGGEIHAHRWIRPGDALHAQRAGALELPPPIFVTHAQLAPFECARNALDALSRGPAPHFFPRIHRVPRGLCSLYAGDAGSSTGYASTVCSRAGRGLGAGGKPLDPRDARFGKRIAGS